jgi:hypothetical protein
VRRFQLQNHDGDKNGDDAIAERFEPVRFHAPECNMRGRARKPRRIQARAAIPFA